MPRLRPVLPSLFLLLLAACGGGGGGGVTTTTTGTLAQNSDIAFAAAQPGVTPFISLVKFQGQSVAKLQFVTFTIAPAPGAVARPVHVQYTAAGLHDRGDLPGDGTLTLPVFGLYAGASNAVSVDLEFSDYSVQTLPVAITTAAWVDPNGIYDHATVLQARNPAVALGYDYFYLKSGLGPPVVLDTDGQVRWIAAAGSVATAFSSSYDNNQFVVGDLSKTSMNVIALDGTVTPGRAKVPDGYGFSQNIQPGKIDLISEFDTVVNSVTNTKSTLVEMTSAGESLYTWDLGQIIGDYMSAHGDNAAAFVRPGFNWLHLNSALYDPGDDSLIVSSREDFVMKLDYVSRQIKWILGDPTKYWYTFPSLRALAVTLQPGDFYPIGQLALTFTHDGLLMLYNDGTPSFNQPPGAPAGASRPFTVVSAYTIDPVTLTGHEVWRYDHGQDIKAAFCGSSYEAADRSLLVDYATADNGAHARFVGVDANRNVAFDFEFANTQCTTGWNAQMIGFDNLFID